jgi:hypothetical protein
LRSNSRNGLEIIKQWWAPPRKWLIHSIILCWSTRHTNCWSYNPSLSQWGHVNTVKQQALFNQQQQNYSTWITFPFSEDESYYNTDIISITYESQKNKSKMDICTCQ